MKLYEVKQTISRLLQRHLRSHKVDFKSSNLYFSSAGITISENGNRNGSKRQKTENGCLSKENILESSDVQGDLKEDYYTLTSK